MASKTFIVAFCTLILAQTAFGQFFVPMYLPDTVTPQIQRCAGIKDQATCDSLNSPYYCGFRNETCIRLDEKDANEKWVRKCAQKTTEDSCGDMPSCKWNDKKKTCVKVGFFTDKYTRKRLAKCDGLQGSLKQTCKNAFGNDCNFIGNKEVCY